MQFPSPGSRTLNLTWLLLMALSVGSMISGGAGPAAEGSLGWPRVALLLALTQFKAHQILTVYLNLRASTRSWRLTLNLLIAAISLLTLLAYSVTGWQVTPTGTT